MIPVVSPIGIRCLLFIAPAAGGTNGGEQMAETETIRKVSTSIFASQQKSECNAIPPKTLPTKKAATIGSKADKALMSVCAATEIQKTKIRYIPKLKLVAMRRRAVMKEAMIPSVVMLKMTIIEPVSGEKSEPKPALAPTIAAEERNATRSFGHAAVLRRLA